MSDISPAFDELWSFDERLSSNQAYLLVSHEDVDGSIRSCKISLDNLASQLNSCIIGIGSAAYCQSSDFALSSHDHDIYTSAMYSSNVTSTVAVDVMSMTDMTHSCTYEVMLSADHADGISQTSSVEDLILSKLPKLGQIQFIAVKDLLIYADKFDVTSPEFIGWIPAQNSTAYDLSDFILSSDIPKVFQTSVEGRFIVPNLVDFCKISNAGDDVNGSYEVHSGEVHTPLHSHALSIPGDGASITFKSQDITVDQSKLNSAFRGLMYVGDRDINFTITGAQLNRNVSQLGIHNGMNTSENVPISLPLTKTVNDFGINDLMIVEEDGDDAEFPYPSHNLMPVIIYIGPSRHTDLRRFIEFA